MIIILPKFVIELEEKLKKIIEDIAIKNKIDLVAVDDSRSIEDGIALISNTLVRLYENYDIDTRKRMEEFEKQIKEEDKKWKNK